MRKLAAVMLVGSASVLFAQETPSDSAAAAPAAGQPATQPAAYGKPITADINPGQAVSYRSTNRDVAAYWVTPKGDAKTPVVIYIHDIFGMTDFARAQADALARQGYSVLAPNLYSRVEGSEHGFDAQGAWVAYEKTSDQQMLQDLLAAIEYVNEEGKPTADQPLGVVGHDMGGIFAMKLAGSDLRVTAAVNYYGRVVYANTSPMRPTSPVEDLFNMRAPLLSFYGGVDPQVPRDQVRALESRLEHNPNKTYYELVKLPNVGHGFLVPGRQGYNADAATQAQERAKEFLARYLRAKPKTLDE